MFPGSNPPSRSGLSVAAVSGSSVGMAIAPNVGDNVISSVGAGVADSVASTKGASVAGGGVLCSVGSAVVTGMVGNTGTKAAVVETGSVGRTCGGSDTEGGNVAAEGKETMNVGGAVNAGWVGIGRWKGSASNFAVSAEAEDAEVGSVEIGGVVATGVSVGAPVVARWAGVEGGNRFHGGVESGTATVGATVVAGVGEAVFGASVDDAAEFASPPAPGLTMTIGTEPPQGEQQGSTCASQHATVCTAIGHPCAAV